MSSYEHPVRTPPPHPRTTVNAQGIREPVMEHPVIECAQRVQLRGVWVQCVRRAGHPVYLNFAHSNGYTEWAFDEEKK